VVKTFKYRLFPSKKTSRLLSKCLEVCRLTYNNILEKKIDLYEKEKKSLSKFDINNILTKQKENDEDLKSVHSQIIQNISKRISLAYENFFRRVKLGLEKPGFPRFKSFRRYHSFTFPQNNGSFKIEDNFLKLSKIGNIRINLHRPLIGDMKTCTIKKSKTGKWFATFSTIVENDILPENDLEVGIDLGLKTFAVFSDDSIIKNPRFFIKSEKRLKKTQSRFDKEGKGTLERQRIGKILCKVHEKVDNQRDNFCHKISREVINKYQVICIEDLDIKNMLKEKEYLKNSDDPKDRQQYNQEKQRHKNIHDVSWNRFSSLLVYKAEEAGRQLIKINPQNTSKMCSACGELVPKELKDRWHICPKCGLKMDRDKNASINILRLGLESLRRQANACLAIEAPVL